MKRYNENNQFDRNIDGLDWNGIRRYGSDEFKV